MRIPSPRRGSLRTTPLRVVRRQPTPYCPGLRCRPGLPASSGWTGVWMPPEPGRYRTVTNCSLPAPLWPQRWRCKPGGWMGHPFSSGRRMEGMRPRAMRASEPEYRRPEGGDQYLDGLLARVSRGDQAAFEAVYDNLAGPVYGLILRVVRDAAQSEEVSQEVLLEVWRTAARFDSAKGSAATWVMTIAHRRAVDRVRSATAAAEREKRTSVLLTLGDDVAEAVEASLERERVRRCLDGLTELQRESITLAYYGGYSYREVAGLLGITLGTIKTRIRDGLIRLRDCMGVT